MPFLMLSRSLLLIAALLPALSSAASSPATTDSNIDSDADADVLFQTLSALDAAVFDAFNHCSSAEQLRRHARYFAADVEFYHDNGGVTWSRDAMLANTAAHACGRFSRELIPGTFKVFPIKDFGAITQGEHRFCQFANGQCDGRADFVMVWRQRDGRWEITRVLSYGHRPSR